MKINNDKLVKNYLSETLICKMYENCFNCSSENIKIQKLHGGLKNAVYLIENEQEKVVLKVAPNNNSKMLSIDKNNMWWEAKMLQTMSHLDIPAPKLILFDDSCKICDASYMFMSYIPGQVYSQTKKNISLDSQNSIEYQIGKISSKISSISSDHYFLPSVPDERFKNNYEFTDYLFTLLIKDIQNNNLDIDNEIITDINNVLSKNKDSLNSVSKIVLCNADIWDGNILVESDKVSGIVDFADLYFCDELMTFYFHTIDGKRNDNFLKAFGKENLTKDEEIRIEIYRLYVILKMMVDCELKNYGKFDWMYDIYDDIVKKLKKEKQR